jgi:hypothetical protein
MNKTYISEKLYLVRTNGKFIRIQNIPRSYDNVDDILSTTKGNLLTITEENFSYVLQCLKRNKIGNYYKIDNDHWHYFSAGDIVELLYLNEETLQLEVEITYICN